MLRSRIWFTILGACALAMFSSMANAAPPTFAKFDLFANSPAYEQTAMKVPIAPDPAMPATYAEARMQIHFASVACASELDKIMPEKISTSRWSVAKAVCAGCNEPLDYW